MLGNKRKNQDCVDQKEESLFFRPVPLLPGTGRVSLVRQVWAKKRVMVEVLPEWKEC